MYKPHQHRAVPALQKIIAFRGAVKRPENRAAHGNVCVVDTCKCGEERATNVNGSHRERGAWTSGRAQ